METGVSTPYFDYVASNVELFSYNEFYNYNKGDQCTLGYDIYKSLIDNNLGNYPKGSLVWIKINKL